MSDINGKTNVAAGIAPFSTEDKYETHTDIWGKGGYRSVETIADRDNITEQRRKEGMLVGVKSEDKIYKLKGGVTNDDWAELDLGGNSEGLIQALEDRVDEEVIKPTGLQLKEKSDGSYELTFSYSDNQNLSHFIIEKKNPNTGVWEPFKRVDV